MTIRDHEQQLVEAFRRASVAHVTLIPRMIGDGSPWLNIMALATRLLDWTFNPQVALYFAIGSPFTDGDSAVWCYRHEGASYDEKKDPFKSTEIVFFEPRHVSPRIATQSGCFTSHPVEANEQPWRGQLRQLVIPRKVRAQLRRELFRFGVHEQSMFPHLDGVSRHVNWRYSTFPDEQSLHR